MEEATLPEQPLEQKQEDNSFSNEQSSFPLIEEAKKQADRIEAANREAKLIQQRNEELYAKQLLSGRSEAGFKPKTQEEKINEEAKAVADYFFPSKR